MKKLIKSQTLYKTLFGGEYRKLHLFLIAVLSITLTGIQILQDSKWVAPLEADSYVNPHIGNQKAVEKGRKLYMKLCWTCHGKSGKGDGPAAATLKVTPSDYTEDLVQTQSDGALYWKITHGRGEMVSYKSLLSEDQRWTLVNYIREFNKSASSE